MRKIMSPIQFMILVLLIAVYGVFIFFWVGPVNPLPGDDQVKARVAQSFDELEFRDVQ